MLIQFDTQKEKRYVMRLRHRIFERLCMFTKTQNFHMYQYAQKPDNQNVLKLTKIKIKVT